MHVSDLIRAGGSLEDSAYRGQAELTRYEVIDGDARRTELITVDLPPSGEGGRAPILNFGRTIRSSSSPFRCGWSRASSRLLGEVRFPGKYPIHEGETLHSVLVRAGGFDEVAFPEGAVFIREELKKREKDQLELLANRLQSDLAALSLEVVAEARRSRTAAAERRPQARVC